MVAGSEPAPSAETGREVPPSTRDTVCLGGLSSGGGRSWEAGWRGSWMAGRQGNQQTEGAVLRYGFPKCPPSPSQ